MLSRKLWQDSEALKGNLYMSELLALRGGTPAVTMTEEMEAVNIWPLLDEDEYTAVEAAMRAKDVYASITEFEKEFAAYHGAQYSLAQNNGTSTLHAAYFAVGVEPGDEVLCPAYTWHLSVSPVLALHAIPVFYDVDPVTGCPDPVDIKRKISSRTKAINVLHAFGAVAPMDEIMAIAREHNVAVIEDASHAHGASYKGKKVGTIGDIGCFSLQAAKLMTAIEGGVLITDNEEYYDRCIVLGHYERISTLRSERYRKYLPDYPDAPTCFGHKYRMHPWAAALARVQLQKLDERNAVRRRNLEYMTAGITATTDALIPPPEAPGTCRTWLNYVCQYDESKLDNIPRDRVVEALCAEGLPANGGRAGYSPVYWNPLYEERNMWAEGIPFDGPFVTHKVEYRRGDCPVAESIWQRTIGLPSFIHRCDDALLDQSIEAIAKVVRHSDQLSA
jgi:dTDP-4-amino-4,6-dideoxygalactose transaminase